MSIWTVIGWTGVALMVLVYGCEAVEDVFAWARRTLAEHRIVKTGDKKCKNSLPKQAV